MVGAVLSARYRLVRLVGEGGIGAVFEAQDLTGGPPCAVKVLRPEYAAEYRVVSQLYEQVAIASRLSHPNIARCFGHAPPEEQLAYVVGELVEGASVASYLRPGMGYEPKTAVPIARGLLAALAELHHQGIVHGDIKPENVFLTPRPDGPPTVKLLDVGLSKVMEAAGGMMTRTRTGGFLGSPSYMSPEQIRGAREVGQRADLWSVAIILYQWLTGREPFPAPTEAAKMTLILSTPPHPIDQGKPALAPFRGFFVRALERDPADRFTSAEEMEAAMIEAAGIPVPKPLGVSATDMSPQLAPFVPRTTSEPQVEILRVPPKPPASSAPPANGSTLREGQAPMIVARTQGAPWWIVILVAVACLGLGFLAGFLAATG
jgi:serine/threonine-protein kinase